MRIVEDTPHRLVVEDRPWVFALLLVVFILVAVFVAFQTFAAGRYVVTLLILLFGAGVFLGFTKVNRRVRMALDRQSGKMWIRTRTTSGTREEVLPLTALVDAAVQTDKDSEGDTHRLVLVMNRGDGPVREPFTPYLSGSSKAFAVAERIKAFLAIDRQPPE